MNSKAANCGLFYNISTFPHSTNSLGYIINPSELAERGRDTAMELGEAKAIQGVICRYRICGSPEYDQARILSTSVIDVLDESFQGVSAIQVPETAAWRLRRAWDLFQRAKCRI